MKLGRKIATWFLCMCLVVPCFSMMAHAAVNGKLSFENQTAEAGQEVTVTLKGQVDAGVGGRKITITYDSALLEFVSGTNTTKVSDGELQYEASEEIKSMYTAKELCQITFKALGNGTAKVGVSTYDISSSYEIEWTCHNAEVTISGGTPVEPEDEQVEAPEDETVDEPTEEKPEDEQVEETPVEKPAEDDVASSGAEVVISNTTTITLIEDVSEIILPERYNETSVTMDGSEFPAWQDSVNTDMYVIYASSSNGIKSLYQYDTLENTYQRFEAPEQTESSVGVSDNYLAIFGDKANIVLIGAAALLLLFIILIIVLAVKLYNRNAELDEVYDDLDHALAEKEASKKAVRVETEDDVLLETEEIVEEDDSEVEVEFYAEEAIKEFFEEEDDSEVEVEFYVEEPVEEDDSEVEVEFYVDEPVEEVVEETAEEVIEKSVEEPNFDKTIRIPDVEEAIAKVTQEVEYFDDDEEFYDDMDEEFFVNFIDLDD